MSLTTAPEELWPKRPWLVAAGLWVLVLAMIYLKFPPSYWSFVYIAVPTQVLAWAAATAVTVWRLSYSKVGRALRFPVMLVLVAVGGTLINWSFWAPRLYFATHKYAFDAIAQEVRENGTAEMEKTYYGAHLGFPYSMISANGEISVVGEQDGVPAVFLEEWSGIPDDAIGYVYFDGTPRPSTSIDLYGDPQSLDSGIDLGSGWRYISGVEPLSPLIARRPEHAPQAFWNTALAGERWLAQSRER